MAPTVCAPQARRSRYSLLTITYNRKTFLSLNELNQVFDGIKLSMRKYSAEWSDNVGYELKRNILHLHTICSCTRSPWIQPIHGYNIQLKNFPQEAYHIVVKYILKESQNPVAIQQREYQSYVYTHTHPEFLMDEY